MLASGMSDDRRTPEVPPISNAGLDYFRSRTCQQHSKELTSGPEPVSSARLEYFRARTCQQHRTGIFPVRNLSATQLRTVILRGRNLSVAHGLNISGPESVKTQYWDILGRKISIKQVLNTSGPGTCQLHMF